MSEGGGVSDLGVQRIGEERSAREIDLERDFVAVGEEQEFVCCGE